VRKNIRERMIDTMWRRRSFPFK